MSAPNVQIVYPHGVTPPSSARTPAPRGKQRGKGKQSVKGKQKTSSSYGLVLTVLTLASTAIAGFDLILLASGLS